MTDLTTEAFIACLKRFISRRGCPATIYSDNGSNFKGARSDLQELYHFLKSTTPTSAVTQYLLSHRTQWSMIPERSPHFWGLWEAAVKAAKHHIKRIVGPQKLTYEEFSTILCQVEACLNSRPLLAITSHDTDGVSTLTPGHFLVGRPLTAYPETAILQDPALLKSWNKCQAMVQHFWTRWSKDYLQQLQGRSKWRTAQEKNLLRRCGHNQG